MENTQILTLTRRALGGAALRLVAVGMFPERIASAVENRKVSPSTTPATFNDLRHVNAGDLSVAYAELGPSDGSPVLLLHGWPYDIDSFAEVAPNLASRGHRVVVPYFRDYGDTKFLSVKTKRNGLPSALAIDTIKLINALNRKGNLSRV
jgi:hypothetical protein